MRALIVCGSGNAGGYTAAMCRGAAAGLTAAGWTAEVLPLAGLDIAHCTGCLHCKDGRGCVIRDGMDQLETVFRQADLFVAASPIHFSGPSSLLKTALDRFNPYWYGKFPHPVWQAALLCGGRPDPNFTNTVSILKAFGATVGMEWAGALTLGGADEKEAASFEAAADAFVRTLRCGRSGKSTLL